MALILVVDDSPVDQNLAGSLLESEPDFSVCFADDGRSGLKAVSTDNPDLVLTDLQMPHLNGLELVKSLKETNPTLPTILMASRGSEEIAVSALQQGASSYVPKRLLGRELVPTVKRVLIGSQEQKNISYLLARQSLHQANFTLENDLSSLLALTVHLERTLGEMWGLDHGPRMQIRTALEEALVNALHHGNLELDSRLRDGDNDLYYQLAKQRANTRPYKDRLIYVECSINAKEATFSIRDEGPGFDTSSLPDPTDPLYIFRPHGRGLLLIRTFVDSVKFNETGNQITLTKYRFHKPNPETSQNGESKNGIC